MLLIDKMSVDVLLFVKMTVIFKCCPIVESEENLIKREKTQLNCSTNPFRNLNDDVFFSFSETQFFSEKKNQ